MADDGAIEIATELVAGVTGQIQAGGLRRAKQAVVGFAEKDRASAGGEVQARPPREASGLPDVDRIGHIGVAELGLGGIGDISIEA